MSKGLRDMYGIRGESIRSNPNEQPLEPFTPMPHELHPAVQDMAVRIHEAMAELDRLRLQNQALLNKLDIETRLNESLQGELQRSKDQCEYYQSYAIEFRTHSEHVMIAARTLQQSALAMAQSALTKARLDDVEDAVREVVSTINQECTNEARAA